MLRDVVDLHTHTTASGHAYNSIYEMAKSAATKGVELLGITDHGPAMEGSASKHYFRASSRIPRSLFGIRLLFGAELNILDYNGSVDLEADFIRPLDFAIGSLHIECITPGTREENTMAFWGTMQNPKILILGHPDDGTFEVDFEKLAYYAAQNHVLLELNEASVRPGSYRKNSKQNAAEMIEACRKWNTRIIVSSDAHIETDILQHSNALKLLEDLRFPEELIVNTSARRVLDCISSRQDYIRTIHKTQKGDS